MLIFSIKLLLNKYPNEVVEMIRSFSAAIWSQKQAYSPFDIVTLTQ